jgi:hypothetical protein
MKLHACNRESFLDEQNNIGHGPWESLVLTT